MDKQKTVSNGISAQRLLDDPIITSAFEHLEQMYINDWKSSKVDDVVKRDMAYTSMRVLQDFKSALQSIVDSGKIAGKQLERDQRM